MTFLTLRALLVVMEVVDDLDIMHGRAATAFISSTCGFECSNHVGARCADIHNLDPWSAADVVTVSRAWYIA